MSGTAATEVATELNERALRVLVEASAALVAASDVNTLLSRVLDEALTPGATVRSVLTGLSARYPELHRALWHGNELGEHIEVLVDDAVLGIEHSLDSRLTSRDRVTLIGQYLGG